MKYLSIYFLSMLKFITGPSIGPLAGLTYMETVILTIAGMMTSVLIFGFFGLQIRAWYLNRFKIKRRIFRKKSRLFVRIWRKYGEFGVSFLTPVFFSPIGGTLLLVTFGSSIKKILTYMFISAVFWAFVFSGFFHWVF